MNLENFADERDIYLMIAILDCNKTEMARSAGMIWWVFFVIHIREKQHQNYNKFNCGMIS